MKRILVTLSIILNVVAFAGATALWLKIDDFRNSMIEGNAIRLRTQFDVLSVRTPSVVFLGDSLTQGGRWNELFPRTDLANRGISGDTTGNVLRRIDQVFKLKPEKLFVMIGVNDLNMQLGPDVAIANYEKLFDLIDQNIPDTKVYVQSVLPVNDDWIIIDNAHIPGLNVALKQQATQRGYTYIDLHRMFADLNGQLIRSLSNDGIHLLGAGYDLWRREIAGFVND